MGWKAKAKQKLDTIQATLNGYQEDLKTSDETEGSLENFGDDNLRDKVKDLYQYLENDGYSDVKEVTDDEEDDDFPDEDDEEEDSLDEQEEN